MSTENNDSNNGVESGGGQASPTPTAVPSNASNNNQGGNRPAGGGGYRPYNSGGYNNSGNSGGYRGGNLGSRGFRPAGGYGDNAGDGGQGQGGFGGRGPMQRRPRRPGGKDRFSQRRRVCQFCVDKIRVVDYKDFQRLRRFLSDRGKIEPRRKTGTCARHQRSLTTALKRGRYMALLPYVAAHTR